MPNQEAAGSLTSGGEAQPKSVPTPSPSARPRVPQMSFTTFLSFIDEQKKEQHLPATIDRSVFPTLSGTAQAQAMETLEALGLTDSKGKVSAGLRQLIAARGSDEWKSIFCSLLTQTIVTPLLGGLDLNTATRASLEQELRKRSINGDVLDRFVRFLFRAMDEAGISYPARLKKGGTTAPRRDRPSRAAAKDSASEDKIKDDPPPAPQGMQFPIYLPNMVAGKVELPPGITASHVPLIKTSLEYIVALMEKTFESSNGNGKKSRKDGE